MTSRLIPTIFEAVSPLLSGPEALLSDWQTLDILPATASALERLDWLFYVHERLWRAGSAMEALAVPILMAMATDERRTADPQELCLVLLAKVISDAPRGKLEPLYFGIEDCRPLLPKEAALLLDKDPEAAVDCLAALLPAWASRAETLLR